MKFKRRHSSPTNSPQQKDTEQRSRARSNTFPGQETEPIDTSFASTRGFRASNFLPGSQKFSTRFPFVKKGKVREPEVAEITTEDTPVAKVTTQGTSLGGLVITADTEIAEVKTHNTPDLSGLPPGGDPIPQKLHFFWKGDSPGRDLEWQNLQQWGNMGQRSAGWNMTLWTDLDSYDKWQQNQQERLNELARMKIEVKTVENEIDRRNKFVYDYVVRNNARTMVSDVARYNVLKNHGGIYVDLDIAPGNLSLPKSENREGKEILTSGRLPFFGPGIRNKDSLLNFEETDTFEDKLRKTVDYRYKQGRIYNNLIAVESNNPTLDLIIDKISELNEGSGLNDLQPNKKYLDDLASRVTGPMMVGNVMRRQMKLDINRPGTIPEPTKYGYINFKLKDSLIDKMQLLTEASEQT